MSKHAPTFYVEALSKRFGELRAVDDVSLAIPRGEIYGLVGPSGAGKTTLIRMLSGLAVPTAGTAKLLGSSMPSERRAVEGLRPRRRGRCPSGKDADGTAHSRPGNGRR